MERDSAPAPMRSAAAPVLGRLWTDVRETLALGLPVMVARSGMLTMITVDVVMTGHSGADQLAFYSLAFGTMQVFYVLGLGVLMGANVLAAQAVGLGEPRRCGTVWRVGLLYGLVLGAAVALVFQAGAPFYRLIGQGPGLAAGGAGVLRQFAWGMPPVMMYLATALFLEGIARPKANMVLMFGANGLNALLNWALVFDHGHWAGMGAQGAALGTSLTRWALFAALAAYALGMGDARRFGARGALHYPLDFARKLLRVGVPLGLAHGLESGAFSALIFLAGVLGSMPLAAYQIAQNLFSIVYMLAIGIGTAASVRVGNAVGRGDRAAMAWAGWTALGLAGAMFVPCLAGFQLFAGGLAGLYNDSAAVLALAAPAVAIAGFFLVFDGAQGVLMGALRGTGDVWIPMAMVAGGFWGVSVPLARYLAFARGWGVDGIMWALVAGGLAATLMLLGRFRATSRRAVRPL